MKNKYKLGECVKYLLDEVLYEGEIIAIIDKEYGPCYVFDLANKPCDKNITSEHFGLTFDYLRSYYCQDGGSDTCYNKYVSSRKIYDEETMNYCVESNIKSKIK